MTTVHDSVSPLIQWQCTPALSPGEREKLSIASDNFTHPVIRPSVAEVSSSPRGC